MSDPTYPTPAATPAQDPRPVVNGSLWSMTAVAMFFLILRFWIKISRRCDLWWDDGVLALSWVTLVASNATMSYLVDHGFGFIPTTDQFRAITAWSGFTTCFSRVWSKTSFALTLLRILDDKDRFQRLFIWFIILSLHGLSIAYSVLVWRRVCELEHLEDGEAVGRLPGPCLPMEALLALHISNLSLSAMMDFVLALMPWRIVWKLQMRMQEKIGTAIAMSLGLLAGIFAVLSIRGIMALSGTSYSDYKLAKLTIVANAEPTITIVAASLPVLRTLLRDLYHNPTLVEVSSKGMASKAELRRTSTKIDAEALVADQRRGIMQKPEVEIEYSRKSSRGANDSRGDREYELEDWDLGVRPGPPGRAK